MRRLGHARHWIIVLAGLALVAAACAGSGVLPGGKEGPPAQPLTQTHTNEAAGFSMDLPEGWTAEAFLLFTMAAEGAQSAEITELTGPVIFASGWPASEMEGVSSPRDLLGSAELEDIASELTIGELEDTTVGGQPAAAADVSGSDPDSGQELEGRLVVVLGSENAGFFFGATPVGGWDEFAPTFDAIMDSVKFFEPNPELGMEDLFGDESFVPDESTPIITNDIAINDTMSSTLEDGSIHEWVFQGTAGQMVTITVQPESDDLDPELVVVGPDGSELSVVDDGFSGEPEMVNLSLPGNGAYTVRITPFAFGGGPYTISIRGTGPGTGAGGELRQWASRASASSEYGSDSWAAFQATGAPNTYPQCGDIGTAWASSSSSGVEWLELEYDTAVVATRVEIYQTYNPGAIHQVELVDEANVTHVIYQAAPTLMSECPYILIIPVSDVDVPVKRLIIHIDQSTTANWNEIDAVELIGVSSQGGGASSQGGGALSGGAGGDAQMPSGPPTAIKFVNQSSKDICYVYITPSAADSWGSDHLDFTDTSPGGSFTASGMAAGVYDIKVEDCSFNLIAWNLFVDVPASSEPAEALVDDAPHTLTFANDLNEAVCGVYMTRVEDFDTKGWRRNLLGPGEDILAGQSRLFKSGEGDWNFRFETCGGGTIIEALGIAVSGKMNFSLSSFGQ